MAGAAEEKRDAAAYSPISNPFAPRPKALTPPGIGLASLAGLAAAPTSMSPDALPPTDSPSGWRLGAGWAGAPDGGIEARVPCKLSFPVLHFSPAVPFECLPAVHFRLPPRLTCVRSAPSAACLPGPADAPPGGRRAFLDQLPRAPQRQQGGW